MAKERTQLEDWPVDLSSKGNWWQFDVGEAEEVQVSSEVISGTGADLEVKYVDATGIPRSFGTPKTITASAGSVLISESELVGVRQLRVDWATVQTGYARFGASVATKRI